MESNINNDEVFHIPVLDPPSEFLPSFKGYIKDKKNKMFIRIIYRVQLCHLTWSVSVEHKHECISFDSEKGRQLLDEYHKWLY